MKALILALVLGMATGAMANGLPDKPQPQPMLLYTKVDKVELVTALTLAAADSAQTCHSLANGGHEDMLPTQNCAGATLILFGQVAAQEVVARILTKTGHRKLARAVRMYSIVGNTRGLVYSAQHGAL